jgi:hypothetical protein
MDQIMMGDEAAHQLQQDDLKTSATTASKRPLVEDEDEAFEAWKQGILLRAVEAGFDQYKKYLRAPSTA